ncbi:hypothetical protein [Micromonospora endophytica]|uniref:Uncharacterized protein n=1 Tax=Micromonospora endophytica TaxID=515350 RepID=A0A2W2D683_9ACTN|nr:hypothetical protein [Micromonospora endophytica]PZG01045.1 hypothetical protein C1I93_00725 [Micromonospora endophytica]RIW47913.1 hypothetical protein D3H59_08525 [Micromonospora endophytica]BCJ62284.1 sugar kinase [Micromonospora endophytica]
MSEHDTRSGPRPPHGAPTRTAIVGVDVGGTKTHVAVVGADGNRRDVVVPSADWRRGAMFSDLANFERLAALVGELSPAYGRIVIGLHDLDTPEQRAVAAAELSRHLPGVVRVVNDAELLGPAAGLERCLQLIVGTGAIALGRDEQGRGLSADGYGALIADYGSAPALVRDTIRRCLRYADEEGPEAAVADPAMALFCAAYDVRTPADLALAVCAESAYAWGRHAPLVFDALRQGSPAAGAVVDEAADILARNLAALGRRGALGSVVVGAGGVLTAQPELQDRLRERLRVHAPQLTLQVLTAAPVEGALVLAAAG